MTNIYLYFIYFEISLPKTTLTHFWTTTHLLRNTIFQFLVVCLFQHYLLTKAMQMFLVLSISEAETPAGSPTPA